MINFPVLIALDGVCELTGLTPDQVCGMQQRKEFPLPLAGVDGGPHWLYGEIIAWMNAKAQ